MLQRFKKDLRALQTDAENALWYHVRNRYFFGYKFRRQHVLCGYIVDFVCLERKLVIELDGGQHANQTKDDFIRTQRLGAEGFHILRFWNNEVLENMEGILEIINNKLHHA